MKKRVLFVVGVGIVAALALTGLTQAWWVKGHESITEAAAAALPDEMPAFFRAGGKAMAHYAGDPDRWKNPSCRELRDAIAPDHYLDLEDLQGKDLPPTRYEAIALMHELKAKPERVGLLPWAIMENYERLCCAFYDLRQDPDNAAIRAKCLVHAGTLAHFTGDCVMPLHTTRHYDGRIGDDGKKTQGGIHAKIDAFPEKNGIGGEEIARGLKAKAVDDVWPYVVATFKESHKHIDRCYELDKAGAFARPTEESRKFILERCRAGAQFTADLWYSAWLQSAKMPKHY
jgi:hypothetical protein